MKSYVMLCKKHITTKDNTEGFDTFFAYRQEKKEDGTLVDVLSPIEVNGTSQMKAKAIKVALSKSAYEKLGKLTFPLSITLNDELKVDGKDSFYVCINKDKDKKIILDKNGKKHHILVIRDYESAVAVERKEVTLSNFDEFE